MASSTSEELRRRFAEFSKNGRKFDKAIDAVAAGAVKESRFLPSGRKFFTVVGNLGDEFIDPAKPYCSCSDFFFKVSRGGEATCYHLLSHAIASRAGLIDVIQFSDDEYEGVLSAMVGDVFAVLDRS